MKSLDRFLETYTLQVDVVRIFENILQNEKIR